MAKVIKTPDAPSSPLFSQAVKAGANIYVSGLVGVDVTTGEPRRPDDSGADEAGAK